MNEENKKAFVKEAQQKGLEIGVVAGLPTYAVAVGIGVGGTMGIAKICEWAKRN